jgi:DDE superfamily endonuclease
VQSWQEMEYPKIAERARKERALVFFADEAGIRSDNHSGTTWASIGQTPLVKATGARFGFNMLSAVNAQGHFRFMTVEGTRQRDRVSRIPQAVDYRNAAKDIPHCRRPSSTQGKTGTPIRGGQQRSHRAVLPATLFT